MDGALHAHSKDFQIWNQKAISGGIVFRRKRDIFDVFLKRWTIMYSNVITEELEFEQVTEENSLDQVCFISKQSLELTT